MLDMLQQERIRELARKGYSKTEIRDETGFSYPTIRKYLEKDDFSPEKPVEERKESILDPYKPRIAEMLDEDRHCYHKQHHTAKRIFARLRDEEGYAGSYETVRRYVRGLKAARRAATDAFSDLEWPAGWAQADFGQADFDMPRGRQRMHYLAMSFPQSNHALSQVFGDETTVCVTQGLKDMFEHIGGVPVAIVFDNATDAGRRVCGVIREADLFRRFRLHYGFQAVFANPNSGWEKGSVEGKVGLIRRNVFVPVPRVGDLREYNARLLDSLDALSASSPHYEKGLTWAELFKADRQALGQLPATPFDCVDWKNVTADGYGKVTLGRRYKGGRQTAAHRYLASATLANSPLLVGVRAHEVEIDLPTGEVVRTYRRRTEAAFTNDEDPLAVLDVLRFKPRAFACSSVRPMLPDAVNAHLDAMEGRELHRQLETMFEVASAHGMENAAAAFEDVLAATGTTRASDVEMTAARIACTGRRGADRAPGSKLIAYDELLRGRHTREEADNGQVAAEG